MIWVPYHTKPISYGTHIIWVLYDHGCHMIQQPYHTKPISYKTHIIQNPYHTTAISCGFCMILILYDIGCCMILAVVSYWLPYDIGCHIIWLLYDMDFVRYCHIIWVLYHMGAISYNSHIIQQPYHTTAHDMGFV